MGQKTTIRDIIWAPSSPIYRRSDGTTWRRIQEWVHVRLERKGAHKQWTMMAVERMDHDGLDEEVELIDA